MRSTRRSWLTAIVLAAALGAPAGVEAQYFGQNKVVYGRFDFQIIRTEHFDVYFYGSERPAAMDAARMAERAYARLSRILNHEWRDRKPLILYASQSDFVQTNAIAGDIGEGTGGVTEAFKHRMVLPFTGSYADFEHVLMHEMVHAFQYDVISRGTPGGGLTTLANINPPLWFMEGMAEYLSIGPVDAHTAVWVRDAAVEGPFPSIEQMTYDPRIFPYRFGHALFAYVGQKWGDETIGAILQGTMAGGIERAFQRVLGLSLAELSDEWRDAVRATYLPQVADNTAPRRFARVVLNERRSQGTFHVSPQISPDGTQIVYLSERDFFFIDMWLADVESGRVHRRLVRSNFDANYESLRFIYSSGAWSPDGEQFVFAAKRGGEDLINVMQVRSGRVERFSVGVDGLSNPSFSPDGSRIVFTGMEGGWSDLYVVDVDGRNLRRLTNDRYADLLPQWSPDGGAIAFTTDRGPDTNFETLRFGNLRIALYHLDGDSVTVLPRMDEGKNVNPVWSPDGRTLAFLSDRSGIPNVFLYDLAAAQVFQVTTALSGTMGITDLSPSLSWARQADRLVFTAFENGAYNVYAIDNPRALMRTPFQFDPVRAIAQANAAAQPLRADVVQGRGLRRIDAAALTAALTGRRAGEPTAAAPATVPAGPGTVEPAAVPPGTAPQGPAPSVPGGSVYRSGGRLRPSDVVSATATDSAPATPPVNVAALLDSATLELPDTAEFTIMPYRVRFTPDFVSRPSIGYTRDNFGRGFFGGTAIQLSDILGDRSLLFSAAVNGRISEAQLFAAYLNATRRLNWVVGVSQQPIFLWGGNSEYSVDSTGVQTVTQQLRRIVFREAFAQAFYPLNRFKRVEVGVRLVNVSQATLNQHYYYDPSGIPIGYSDDVTNDASTSFAQPSVAYVYDNSLFGYTSSFYGRRFRFEVAPSFGGWHYTQLLGDYRRYDMVFAPFFTLASRVVALGRFGRDGSQFPMFLGSTDLVRGYTYNSFRSTECSAPDITSQTGCPEVDQLVGSRIAVANLEFRFPLIRNLALGFLPIGFPPIEGALFYDIGLAWNDGSDLRWSRRDATLESIRAPVSSYGIGVRANLFNFAILRVDYAVPRQRPLKGGYWMVSLGPPF
jgi:Tol biopolymer transport system component